MPLRRTLLRGFASRAKPLWLALLLCAATWSGARCAIAGDAEFQAAATLYQQQEWCAAAEAFEAYLQRRPDGPEMPLAKFYLAETCVQLGDHRHAYALFSELHQVAVEVAPEMACRVCFRRGECAHFVGLDDQAHEALIEFRQRYPDHPLNEYALPYLAELAQRRGDQTSALRLYNEALERFPHGPSVADCEFGRAESLRRIGELEQARAEFVRLSSGAAPRIAATALYALAFLDYENQAYATAASHFGDFATRFPQDRRVAEAIYWKGLALFGAADYEQSAATLVQAEAALADACSPHEPACWFFAAESFRHTGDVSQARCRYERLLKQAPENAYASDAAGALRRLREQTVRRTDVPTLTAPPEEASLTVWQRARAHIAHQEYAAARELLQAYLLEAGSAVEAAQCHYLIAETYEKTGQSRRAVREYLRIEATVSEPSWRKRSLLAASSCYSHLGRYEAAAQLAHRAKAIDAPTCETLDQEAT